MRHPIGKVNQNCGNFGRSEVRRGSINGSAEKTHDNIFVTLPLTSEKTIDSTIGFGSQYIGITCQRLNRRKSLHINQAKRGDGSVFHEVLREWGCDNFEWKIEGEGEKLEIQRLESRLINIRNTVFPFGFNARNEHAEEYAQRNAQMEQLESDPGYIALKKSVDDFLLKTEIAYESDNPKLYENLDEWEINHETNTLVRRET